MTYSTPQVGLWVGKHRLQANLEMNVWALPLSVAWLGYGVAVRVGPLCFSWRNLSGIPR